MRSSGLRVLRLTPDKRNGEKDFSLPATRAQAKHESFRGLAPVSGAETRRPPCAKTKPQIHIALATWIEVAFVSTSSTDTWEDTVAGAAHASTTLALILRRSTAQRVEPKPDRARRCAALTADSLLN